MQPRGIILPTRHGGVWAVVAGVVLVSSGLQWAEASSVPRAGFSVVNINPDSEYSAATCFDVDGDGHVDIVCGGYWYRGPDWKPVFLREVQRIRGRYDDYSNLPLDVDGDGDIDVVSANYRSATIYWVEQPDDLTQPWRRHLIDRPGRSETAILVDIDGDGEPDVLPNGADYTGWFQRFLFRQGTLSRSHCWLRRWLPPELAGHGIGAGDVNGDGLVDIVGRSGVAIQTKHSGRTRWEFRPEFTLHRDASIPILVTDVDRDGDNDLIYGRGHNIGLYWLEQRRAESGDREWLLHCIDHTVSQIHALCLADINADGWPELIAGKRYLGHDGRDPGEYDPLVVRAYQFLPGQRSWAATTIAWDNGGWDLDPEVADVDGDGDLDLVGPTRAGLYLYRNGLRERTSYVDPVPGPDEVPVYESRHRLLVLRTPDGTEKPITRENLFDWGRRRFQILRNMEKVMGTLPGPERRVPVHTRIVREERTEKYRRVLLRYVAEPGDEVPAYLLIPHELKKPAPAVLVLHQTVNIGKDEVVALGGRPNRQFAHELANRGYVVLAPDYPTFGEYRFDFATQGAHYVSGTMKAIWNNIRGVDLLESLPYVDSDRIAALGHSLGGHNALFTAAFDQRIRAVVTSCGFTGFEYYYGGNLRGWSQARYMPRVASVYSNNPRLMPFDFHDVLAAIAPRPVFINAPQHDHNFYVEGVWDVLDAVRPVYELFGAEENLVAIFPDYGHDFLPPDREAAYQFLDRVLGRDR